MKFLFKKPERKELDKDVLAKDEFFWAKDRGNMHFHLKKKKLQHEVKAIKFAQGLHKTEVVTRTTGRDIFP